MRSRSVLWTGVAAAGLAATISLTLALLPATSGLAQEAKTTAATASALEALPGDATLVLRIRSLSDLQKKFKASPLYGLKDHPDIKKFLDDLNKKMELGLSDARNKLGFDPQELYHLVEGEMVLALGGLDKIVAALTAELSGGEADVKPGDLPILLAVDGGATAPQLRERLAKIFEFAQKDGAKREVEDFQGGKITTLIQAEGKGEEKDKKKDEEGKKDKQGLEKIFFGEMGSKVLLSINRPFLEQTMVNLKSPAPDALAKNGDFAATQREIRADSDFMAFLNIRPVASAARKSLQANAMAAMVWSIVENKVLGRSLKNLGYTMTIREEGIQSLTFVNNAGASDGILGILKGPTIPSRPNPVIPDDVDTFSSVAINVQGLYALVMDVANQIFAITQMGGQPGAAGQGGPNLEQFVEASFGIKLKSVVDALGNVVHVYQRGGPSQENPLGNTSILIELKDEMPIKEVLSKVAMMAALQPQKYLDRDIYPLGAMDPTGGGPALGIADKLLVVGVKSDSVKEVIRRAGKEGKGVGDTPGFQALAARVPGQVNIITYSSAKAFRDSLSFIKEALALSGEDFPVPDLTPVADVMGGGIGHAVWKDQGFYSESLNAFKKK